MITCTKLNQEKIIINESYIKTIEETPDTVITFMDDKKIIVKETMDQIKKQIIDYRKEIFPN